MKNRALFSSKDKSKKSKCRLLQFLFGALRVKTIVVFVNLHALTINTYLIASTDKESIDNADDTS